MDKNYKQEDFPLNKWALVNMETGETVDQKIGKLTLSTPTRKVSITYKSFVYLDTNRLMVLLLNGISETELGFLLMISYKLSFALNVCMLDDENPHTKETISRLIGQSWASVNRKIKRLVELKVLAFEKIPNHESWGKVIIINPYFFKRGKSHTDFLSKIFYDFTSPAE